MCGICGKVSSDAPVDPTIVQRMMDAMVHRGPDGEGLHAESHVALGHRRLSIIDLDGGRQPLSNEDGTVWVVFNGEIYNYLELREELTARGHHFSTASDTEVIVHLYEDMGPECVQQLRGMFAFALWDMRTKRLLIARDRVGIKPLYFSCFDRTLLFASEVKALLADPQMPRTVDVQGVARFLTHLYVPGPHTLLQGVQKLEPGHYLLWEDGKLTIRQYWDLVFPDQSQQIDMEAATEELTELLRQTVRQHMLSDVPVGVLLSGGVDSSGLLSFCVDETHRGLDTFTVGFDGHVVDERPYARLAAERYGTTHHEMTVTADAFLDFLPKYVWHMEEPVCEPPAIALYYVSQLARAHVKVLISGEGGDEAFAGYSNYRNLMWLERMKRFTSPCSSVFAAMLTGLARFRPLARLGKYSRLVNVDLQEYYFSRTASPFSWFNAQRDNLFAPDFRGQIDARLSSSYVRQCFEKVAKQPLLNQMLYVDTKTWLPDDLLVKADKMTMASSVELRVPLLDHKVLEFAARLPPSFKVHGASMKHILKKALQGRVPREILNRRKAGFPVPVDKWMNTDLRQFTRDVLLDSKTISRGYFNRSAIEQLLRPHSSDDGDRSLEMFSLVVLELWHRQFADAACVA